MRRGTTPTYTLTVDTDLTGWTCYVALRSAGRRLDLGMDRLEVVGGEQSTVGFELTQAETLGFRPGRCEVQLRAAKGDAAIATDIAQLEVGRILRDGEIHA